VERNDQGPKIKRENIGPGFSQSRPGIGGEREESGFHTQSADISQGRRVSSMGGQHAYDVPEQGFKSEKLKSQENCFENNVLSQHMDRKANTTEMATPAVVKQEHNLSETKRKIKVEEEEDGDTSGRLVSKQRR